MSTLNAWLQNNPEHQHAFNKERFILEVTESIWDEMLKENINKQQLATALDCSKANVTRMLDGSRNLTLSSLFDIATALNAVVKVSLESKDSHQVLNASLEGYKRAPWSNVKLNSNCQSGKIVDMGRVKVHQEKMAA